jgi:tetratricopeptide (TPR) repeat protein
MYPKAGLLAPKEEKLFVKGVTAYMQGRFEEAVQLLGDVSARDTAQSHVGEELFEGMSLIGLNRLEEAIEPLEVVLASDQQIPDALMGKYGVGGTMVIGITDQTEATMPISTLSAALMLAEVYQRTSREQKAIELLESLGSVGGDPLFALSLAELYGEQSRWDEVTRVTDGFVTNEDDVTLEILCRRANALAEQGTFEAALEVTKEALRYKKRNPQLLRLARYVRGVAYERKGKGALARKEFERIYADDRGFADVASRLGLGTESETKVGLPSRPDRPD